MSERCCHASTLSRTSTIQRASRELERAARDHASTALGVGNKRPCSLARPAVVTVPTPAAAPSVRHRRNDREIYRRKFLGSREIPRWQQRTAWRKPSPPKPLCRRNRWASYSRARWSGDTTREVRLSKPPTRMKLFHPDPIPLFFGAAHRDISHRRASTGYRLSRREKTVEAFVAIAQLPAVKPDAP